MFLLFQFFKIEWYKEDYNKALKSLKRAQELEPTWVDPKNKYEECRNFLLKLSSLAKNKGQLNQRKITSLVAVGAGVIINLLTIDVELRK